MLASTSSGESGRPTGSVGFSRKARIFCGLARVDVDDAELVGEADRLADRGDRAAGAGLDVVGDHLREVHPVDVVGAHHDDDVGLLVGEQVERLEDRVRAAEVPPLAHALLGRHRGDVVAQQVGHPPGRGDVAVEAVRLVLREHDDLEVAGVHDVGQREVDQAVDPSERHRRFGPVGRERHQTLALTACQDDCEDLLARGRDGHATKLVVRGGAVDLPTDLVQGLRSAHAHRRPQQGVPTGGLRRCRSARRRAGPRPAGPPRHGRAGALLRGPALRGRHHGVRRAVVARGGQPGHPHARRRPRDGRRLRRCRPGPLPHLVRQHGRPPRRADARHPARRQRPLPRADAAVEGRAARRRLRPVELGGAHGVRGCRRDRGGERRDARRRAAQLSRGRPRPRPRRAQRHRHHAVVARSPTPTASASSASTPTARA